LKCIQPQHCTKVFHTARSKQLIDDEDTTLILLDFDVLEDRVRRLQEHFPPGTLHAVAVKTNPLAAVLRYLAQLGTGLEAASLAEVMMAGRALGRDDHIVFDSPAKTATDVAYLTDHQPGCYINVDNLDELALYPQKNSPFPLGLRVNPLIQTDSPDYLSVAGKASKFGVSFEYRKQIIEAFAKWDDLRGLHLHIGSSFQDLNPSVRAIGRVLELAEEINQTLGEKKVEVLDIGGGFPVNYGKGEPYYVEEYAALLKEHHPQLWTDAYKVITEFGRYVHANAAWAVSKVEYVKPFPGGENAVIHAGADMFLRESYQPGDWHHDLYVMDAEGQLKSDVCDTKTNIAGPLCFGGDFLDRGRALPPVSPGDWLMIADVGANTFSLWSRHCSRPFPKVLGFSSATGGEDVRIIKERESYEMLTRFWG
tara:strand:+ start:8883 stop:10151 length:1269 start_codon:yes stop_codon:yes gene_type:complete